MLQCIIISMQTIDQNIPCSFRVASIFTKISRQAEIKLDKASPPFRIQVAGRCKLNKYVKFDLNISCGSRVMSIFTY